MPQPDDSKAVAGDVLAAALAYAARGWRVFPVARDKTPLTANGFKDASVDNEQLAFWWRLHPAAGVAIATGVLSGLVVLDEDNRNGGVAGYKQLTERVGALPLTYVVLTGGGGQHRYFAHPGVEVPCSSGQLGPGLDVRGDGGYVIAPPSIHASGHRYTLFRDRELAPWPAEQLERAAPKRKRAAKPSAVIPEGRRNTELTSLAGALRRKGLGETEMLALLRETNTQRCRPPLADAKLAQIAASVSRYEPAEQLGIEPYTGPRRELGDVVATFERNLYLPDPGVVYVTLATVAANRLDGDPSWTILVGPSSGGKTEVLNAVAGLDDVHHAGTLTEASLLSGTPSREQAKGARGGMLRVIGERGLLVCKDFGSMLSMHRDARAATLAALREIYDGSWDRHVGTDGGRSLHWDGKLGLIAGATPAIDQHHGALAVLGDRFVFYRLRLEDASEQARRSLDNTRRIGELRAELRDAVSGFFSGLELDGRFPVFGTNETERLVALATLVVRCRSAVIRDTYQSREVELVPDAEAPGRLVGALGRLLAALRLIGVPEDQAWAIVVKTGLDSMPVLRRRILELLLATAGAQTTTDVAAVCDLPTTTTKRVLEDLTAHGVLRRHTAEKGEAHQWEAVAWTRRQYTACTKPEMSEEV